MNDLEKALARYEWQPIETAPKDGTKFFACGLKYNFWPPKSVEYHTADHLWMDSWGCEYDLDRFTHWMPLPTPPQQPEAGEG